MSKGRVLALLAAIVLLLGGLIYGSLTTIQSECDLCIEYNGQRQCRSGSGSDEAGGWNNSGFRRHEQPDGRWHRTPLQAASAHVDWRERPVQE